MATSTSRMAAARRHGRRAVTELRHLIADSTLYWVLSHKGRVGQFRKAVKGTRAEEALDALLHAMRRDATRIAPARPKRPRVRRAHRATRRTRVGSWLKALSAQPFPM